MQTILVEVRDGVAELVLNRPEVRNAMNDLLLEEIINALDRLAKDPAVRVLVVAGQGTAFCAGADLDWMRRAATYSEEENRLDAGRLGEMLSKLHGFPRPVIAKVNGPAVAGGMGLVAACDVVVAANGAHFALTEVRIGLVPATISPYVVRAIGYQASRRYMLSGERISAIEAHRLGFVQVLCEPAELDQAVMTIAERMRAGGPSALQRTKELLSWVACASLDDFTIARTVREIASVRGSPEGREGLSSFLEKRAPAWSRP